MLRRAELITTQALSNSKRSAAIHINAARLLWSGTFHSIGHRMLRRHAEQAGFKNNFTILDREDARDLLKACMGESDTETNKLRFPKPDVLQEVFSLAVNTRKSVAEIVAQQYQHFAVLTPEIVKLEKKFQERKRTANVMDFDDLLVLWLELIEKNEELRERYQRKFQFILVDEYQDTNKIQGELIDLLAARRLSDERAEKGMGRHLPHHGPIGVGVDDRDHLVHSGQGGCTLGLQRRAFEGPIDIARDRARFEKLERAMGEDGNPAKRMQQQIFFGELGERIDLDRPVLDFLRQQGQPGDPVVDAVSVSMKMDRVRHPGPL